MTEEEAIKAADDINNNQLEAEVYIVKGDCVVVLQDHYGKGHYHVVRPDRPTGRGATHYEPHA